jgi:hypothetical protein
MYFQLSFPIAQTAMAKKTNPSAVGVKAWDAWYRQGTAGPAGINNKSKKIRHNGIKIKSGAP